MRRAGLLLALLPCAAGASLAAKLGSALRGQGDSPVATVSCVGADRTCGAIAALGTPPGGVMLVDAPTQLALADVGDLVGGVHAAAASDVIVLEVRSSDVISQSPHGLAQLAPLLRRLSQVQHLRPQKKLLLLAITEYESGDVAEADLAAFATTEINRYLSALASDTDDMLAVQCCFIPPGGDFGALKARFTSAGAAGYIFAEGKHTSPASATLSCLDRLGSTTVASVQPASPAAVDATYRCGLVADTAAKAFQKGLAPLRKAADVSLMMDFGEQAGALLTTALDDYDAGAAELGDAPAVGVSRRALAEQLRRAVYAPYRKQVAALQRQVLGKFRAKLGALKPSIDVEEVLAKLLSESSSAFDDQARDLLPTGASWTTRYEKEAVMQNLREQAKLHVDTLRVQGLYLPKTGQKIPVDLSAHWLLMHPFGRDSRFDPVGREEEFKFKPKAAPMRLRATGYRPKTKLEDPEEMDPDVMKMVFGDKMIQ